MAQRRTLAQRGGPWLLLTCWLHPLLLAPRFSTLGEEPANLVLQRLVSGGWSLTGSVRDEGPSSRPGRHTWAYFFALGPTMHTPLTATFKLGCLLFICSPGFLPGCDFLGSGLGMGSQFRAHGSSLSPTVPPPPRQAHRTVWNGWGCLKPRGTSPLTSP